MPSNAKLIDNATGDEIPLSSEVPDSEGRMCLIEALVDHPEHGAMVLISHEAAGAHVVFPCTLNAHIEPVPQKES
jgi:hypothetical protein